MRNLIILLFIPFLSFGQVPDLLQLANWQQANSNKYTLDNAARPTPNEVDATTGMNSPNNCTFSSVSASPSPYNGTHSVKITVTTAGTSSTCYLDITGLESGKTYKISMYLNKVSSGNWGLNFWDDQGWTVSSNESYAGFSSDVWNYKEYTKTTNATTGRLLFSSTTAGGPTVELAIDNIVITEI